MIVHISGKFTKIAFARDLDKFLLRGESSRPAGRFNRPGQDALYLSHSVDGARSALSRYVKDTDSPRVAVQYDIEQCNVIDLRHPDAAEWLSASRGKWEAEMKNKRIPKSWEVADEIRESGVVGLIDPSRQNPEAWHLVLFKWNEPQAPTVELVGDSAPVLMNKLGQ